VAPTNIPTNKPVTEYSQPSKMCSRCDNRLYNTDDDKQANYKPPTISDSNRLYLAGPFETVVCQNELFELFASLYVGF
jgi:hypothetical protein